ncbi:MAG TPA: hypothetical protein VG435_02535 [Acidimicrobiales bacterium]|nr:hypothetical protein [Acidimicrobiales bacterium]
MGQKTETTFAAARFGRDLDGRWVNPAGTVIHLVTHPDGRLSGSIRVVADGPSYNPHELRGTCVERPGGDRGIVATVPGWPGPAAAMVWCGDLSVDASQLITRVLVTGGPEARVDWEEVVGGATFTRAGAATVRRSA